MTFRRSLIALTLVVAVLVTAAGPAHAGTRTRDLRHRMFRLVNRSRQSHGLASLRLSPRLSRYAWEHSRRMARRDSVYHSTDVWGRVRRLGASYWGENVGMAGTLSRMEQLFMHSAPHRANILSRHFRYIGVGVVRARGAVWITLDFYGG